MARKILISFKETAEDLALYEDIKKHSNPSGYIKDILKGLVKEESPEPVKKASYTENDEINNILGGL